MKPKKKVELTDTEWAVVVFALGFFMGDRAKAHIPVNPQITEAADKLLKQLGEQEVAS